MCGIIGYVGEREAIPLLIEGLKKLEYRGYDSAGVGIIHPQTHRIVVRKTPGKILNLQRIVQSNHLPKSTIGISHTRWATHGAPNKVNAHPHADDKGKILIVHNGIIENYEILKNELKEKGHRFVSDTDTEVAAQLIAYYYHGDLLTAVKKAISRLKGAFALGVIAADHPDHLIAARVGSPLIIGLGKNENFIASDVPAVLKHTRRIIYLKDGQIAVIRKNAVQVFTFAGKAVKPRVNTVNLKLDAVQKQGFAHFMLKEIHEQPDVIRDMLQARLRGDRVVLDGLHLADKQLKDIQKIFIVACGTAYHAGMVGRYVIEQLARRPVMVDVASEFRYRNPIVDKKTLIIAISQSGETADTLAAVREAKAKGAKIISICNVVGSSLTRESDSVLYTHAGPEIGVASTKAYTAQLCMLYLLAIKLAAIFNSVSRRDIHRLVGDLKRIPSLYQKVLHGKMAIKQVAVRNAHFGCFLFLGRNMNYPTALEGALKLKEISYIPAEGYAAGEMKHGPIALIDEYRAVICVAVEADTYEKIISNIQEAISRKGKVVAIATEGDQTIKDHAHQVIFIPKTNRLLTPLLAILPLQLIAYYIAVKRGCDVDQPRNLAKSVTVE